MQIWGNMVPALTELPKPGWCRRDALIPNGSAGLVLCTHSGYRSPTTKVNDGEAAGVFCYNSAEGDWGGNWFSILLVAPAAYGPDAVTMRNPSGTASSPVLFTYQGRNYYGNTASMNPNWGGVQSYDGYNNLLGLPELWDTRVFVVNGVSFFTDASETVGDLLRLR